MGEPVNYVTGVGANLLFLGEPPFQVLVLLAPVLFFGRFAFANLQTTLHQLLCVHGKPTAFASVMFQCAIIGEYSATLEAVVRCHFGFGLRSSNLETP
jgi:hypothetical protein